MDNPIGRHGPVLCPYFIYYDRYYLSHRHTWWRRWDLNARHFCKINTLFSLFFPCQQEEKNRCTLNVARSVALSCTSLLLALRRSSITTLPGIIFARSVRILWDRLWLERRKRLPRCTHRAPWHAEVASQARPARALQTCCSLSVHRR